MSEKKRYYGNASFVVGTNRTQFCRFHILSVFFIGCYSSARYADLLYFLKVMEFLYNYKSLWGIKSKFQNLKVWCGLQSNGLRILILTYTNLIVQEGNRKSPYSLAYSGNLFRGSLLLIFQPVFLLMTLHTSLALFPFTHATILPDTPIRILTITNEHKC